MFDETNIHTYVIHKGMLSLLYEEQQNRLQKYAVRLNAYQSLSKSIKYFSFFVQCPHMPLWTSWSSLLGMVAV